MVQHFQTLPEIGRSGLNVCTILKSTKTVQKHRTARMKESGDPCWGHPKILELQVRFVETSSRTPPAPWPTKPGYSICHKVGLACRPRRFNSLVVQLRCAALEACSWREGTHVWCKACGKTFCSAPEFRCRCALSTRLHSRYTSCRHASRARKTSREAKNG